MRTFVRWSLIVIGIFMILTTLLPFIRTDEWWIREMEFPRVQIAIVAAITALLLFLFFRKKDRLAIVVAAALLPCTVYQVWKILPYTPIAPIETIAADGTDRAPRLDIVVANVKMDNRRTGAFLEMVEQRDPDLLLMLEPDAWWDAQTAVLGERYPHAIKHAIGNTYGIILYSRFPLADGRVRFLVEDTIPSIIARVRIDSTELVDLYCVHPRPPIPESDSEQRDAELLIVAREVKRAGRPAIVMGDLNDVAWSATTELFQEISGLLDPRKGRGFYNTFHAGYFFLRYPLDHIFHTPHFRLISLQRGPDIGSDHFPIIASIDFAPHAAHHQDAPDSDAEERRKADEMIEEGVKER